MALVSINSLEELQFVKYKLREKRYLDMSGEIQVISEKMNASFYAHIGLFCFFSKLIIFVFFIPWNIY
jgi:hypothetical protein